MKRSWVLPAGAIVVAVAIGFQQVEPLDELREHGTVAAGGWHRDSQLHGFRFVPKDASVDNLIKALDVLPRCPSVNRVVVPKSAHLREVLSRLSQIEQIVALELFDKDVADADLAGLAGMKQLQFLELNSNPRITDAGVAALVGLENLRYLDLTQTNVTGTGLKDRADMVNLEQLTLNDCPVTDESLAAIPRFPKLEVLFLGRTKVTDEGLMSLVGWHSLRRVTRTALTTKAGSQAFNEAFLAARRKAREAGVPMNPRDIPPVFLDNWRE